MAGFIDTVQVDDESYSLLDKYAESFARMNAPANVETVNMFNMYDPRIRKGMYIVNATIKENSSYFISHPIKVNRGVTYKFNVQNLGAAASTAVWTFDGTNLGESIPAWGVATGIVEFTPDRTGYILFSSGGLTAAGDVKEDTFMFCEADKYPEEYVPYTPIIREAYIPQSQVIKESESLITPNQTSFCVTSANIFNKDGSNNLEGYFLTSSHNGVISQASGYNLTGPVSVEKGKTYIYHRGTSHKYGANFAYAYVNSATDMSISKVEYGELVDEVMLQFTAPRTGYVRLNTALSFDELVVAEADKYPEIYEPYGNTLDETFGLNDRQKQEVLELGGASDPTSNASPLTGKILTVNGDSICYGAGYRGGYAKIIGENNNMTVQNIGVGGGTITAETYTDAGTARHWISQTVDNMNANADYAILEGGVNDAGRKDPLGTLSSNFSGNYDTTTFYGAFEYMLYRLVTRFAGKKYGYIAVHQMVSGYRVSDDEATSYYWAARKCCEKWGVPFLDLNISCPPFAYFMSSNVPDALKALTTTYTHNGDGWHPNEEGYKKYYVPKIEAWLKTL